jgi:hypothetical protein
MVKLNKFIVLLLMLFFNENFGKAAITYAISGGQFGDQTIHYCIAKELSIKYGIPFYYRPFKYADQLMLSTTDLMYSDALFNNYTKINIGRDFDSVPDLEADNLYIVSPVHWYVSEKDLKWFGAPSDNEIRSVLKDLLKPLDAKIYKKLDFVPEGAMPVAVHVRKGEGHDNAYNSPNHPYTQNMEYYIRVPYDCFYIEALRKIRSIFKDKLLYIYIFTDVYDREAIVNEFEKELNDPLMIFHKGHGGINQRPWEVNVLEDIFLMSQFDCFIRAHSSYSAVAQAIGDHKYLIVPSGKTYEGILEYVLDENFVVSN